MKSFQSKMDGIWQCWVHSMKNPRKAVGKTVKTKKTIIFSYGKNCFQTSLLWVGAFVLRMEVWWLNIWLPYKTLLTETEMIWMPIPSPNTSKINNKERPTHGVAQKPFESLSNTPAPKRVKIENPNSPEKNAIKLSMMAFCERIGLQISWKNKKYLELQILTLFSNNLGVQKAVLKRMELFDDRIWSVILGPLGRICSEQKCLETQCGRNEKSMKRKNP